MKPSIWITHGRTESGDDIEMVAWSQEPDGAAILDHYRPLMEDEFDCFGDDFMSDCIQLDEVEFAS